MQLRYTMIPEAAQVATDMVAKMLIAHGSVTLWNPAGANALWSVYFPLQPAPPRIAWDYAFFNNGVERMVEDVNF